MRACDALRAFLEQQAEAMARNEDGTRRNLDPKFLHDFRVAVRRTRSVLGQLKGVLAEDAVAPFATDFRWLGSVTGPCRDLDVMKTEIHSHLGALEPAARDDLVPLVALLTARRHEEHARVAAALASDRYRRLMTTWRSFLRSDGAPTARGRLPVETLAAKRLAKLARRIARRGARIDFATPVADLHRLRIDGKKLRYLLELFRPLLPPGPASQLIRRLKQLQDHLGGWHDRQQQKLLIEDAVDRMRDRGEMAPETLVATRHLLAVVEGRAEAERRQAIESVAALLPRLEEVTRLRPAAGGYGGRGLRRRPGF